MTGIYVVASSSGGENSATEYDDREEAIRAYRQMIESHESQPNAAQVLLWQRYLSGRDELVDRWIKIGPSKKRKRVVIRRKR